jgi:hypothetical protein
MKLIAYQIDVDGTMTAMNDLGRSWTEEELNGNPAFHVIKDADPVPADHEDISSIVNWDAYGQNLIGSVVGFKDWKALRNEIKILALAKTSDDLDTNWSSLDSAEQQICCVYLTNLVTSIRFAETYSDSSERGLIAANFDKKSTESREQRYLSMRMYLMGKIGGANSMAYLKDVISLGLVEMYHDGIEQISTDGVSGLFDNINATAGTEFETGTATGTEIALKDRSFQIVDGSADTLQDVCDVLTFIGINGIY